MTGGTAIAIVGAGLVVHQVGLSLAHHAERRALYEEGGMRAHAVGKPFLLVGRPYKALEAPCSPDVTLDLDPETPMVCPTSGLVGDVTAIPYPDHYFGAALASHVIEHLGSIERAARAWSELWRVSDAVAIAWPRRSAIWHHTNPEHMLWTEPVDSYHLYVEERYPPFRQAIVTPTGEVVWP